MATRKTEAESVEGPVAVPDSPPVAIPDPPAPAPAIIGAAARDLSDPVEPVMKLDVRVWAATRRGPAAAFMSWIAGKGFDQAREPAEWVALFETFQKSTPVK